MSSNRLGQVLVYLEKAKFIEMHTEIPICSFDI